MEEEHNGKFKVTLGPETEVLERPRGKDIDVQMVVDLRRMLSSAGLAGRRAGDRGRALARPWRRPVGQPHLSPDPKETHRRQGTTALRKAILRAQTLTASMNVCSSLRISGPAG